jgi:hypothetical protein
MNCLSSEDLKEERDCSLNLNPTLNPRTCPILGEALAASSRSHLA